MDYFECVCVSVYACTAGVSVRVCDECMCTVGLCVHVCNECGCYMCVCCTAGLGGRVCNECMRAPQVSVRLHDELEAVEEKRLKAEDDAARTRDYLTEVEHSRTALQTELQNLHNEVGGAGWGGVGWDRAG